MARESCACGWSGVSVGGQRLALANYPEFPPPEDIDRILIKHFA